MALKLMYITNRPEVAKIVEKNEIDRVWIDLETRGKEERQRNMNTVKSHHTMQDISCIRKCISKSKLLVRINPMYEDSEKEINEVIKRGSDIVMLPMFKTHKEVKEFIDIVDGRVKSILLLETKEAMEDIDNILNISGIDEVHIGLNDLHLSLHKKFMFELLADGTVELLAKKINEKKIPFGFGGIAALEGGMLPAKKIMSEHYRIGSSGVILSRSFCNPDGDIKNIEKIFDIEVKKIREYEQWLKNAPKEYFLENRNEVKDIVKKIIANE